MIKNNVRIFLVDYDSLASQISSSTLNSLSLYKFEYAFIPIRVYSFTNIIIIVVISVNKGGNNIE